MKSKFFYILILIIGIIILVYPVISNKLAEKAETDLIVKYNDEVGKMSQEDVEQMKKEAITYNKELDSQEKITSNYMDLLKVGEIIGYIDIPKINVYLPIYHGTSDYILSKGVGHIETTSLPVGGSSTHAVLAAHTGFSRAILFSNLHKIKLEDIFYIHILDESLKYKVEQIKIIDPENAEDLKYLEVQEERDLVTLMTCSRIGVNKYRLLVTGSRVEDTQEMYY